MEVSDWPTGTGTRHTRISSVFREPDWNAREDCVYIGLPGYAGQETGYFGKPHKLLSDPRGWRAAYIEYLDDKVDSDPVYAGAVIALHGKTLICFCKGKDGIEEHWCHGDYLAYMSEILYHYVGDWAGQGYSRTVESSVAIEKGPRRRGTLQSSVQTPSRAFQLVVGYSR